MKSTDTYRQARLSRDPRFDGLFFIAVKTTGIYCRPICPAITPKEANVEYYMSAVEAAEAGYRPCLRCRPDSAPLSSAWKGTSTTFERALSLINLSLNNNGTLIEGSISQLTERLGITERYLRKLFNEHMGISPKRYALYQQCFFAKQLLHQTQLPINQIAFASGFSSIRRFNDCFINVMQLSPSAIRNKKNSIKKNTPISLKLYFRPPYNWTYVRIFLSTRAIDGLEWCDSEFYTRTFDWYGSKGEFTAYYIHDKNHFKLEITIDKHQSLYQVVKNIRRILDLDADLTTIDRSLKNHLDKTTYTEGLRLPGIGSVFEAGIRAILGQQISVTAAHALVKTLVEKLGEAYHPENESRDTMLYYFPKPESLANHALDFFKMPTARKQTLRDFAAYHIEHKEEANNPDNWESIKGIEPWTINYAKLRGLSDPDIFLAGDVGIINALAKLSTPINPDSCSPWRSYLSLQLWNSLI